MKKILTLTLFLSCFISLNAQVFGTLDESFIKSKTLELISKYDKYGDFTTDGINFSDDYLQSFKALFADTSKVNIYNDLQSKNNYISVTEYLKIVKVEFPLGIETKIDSSSIKLTSSKLILGDIYSIDVIADKYVVGLTKENKLHRKKLKVHLKVQFTYANDDFHNFRIKSIINDETLMKLKSDNQMSGLYIGGKLSIGTSMLNLTGNSSLYQKENSFPASGCFGIYVTYFLNSNIGISLGVNYSILKSKNELSYNNLQQNNLERTDMDGDQYYLYIDSKLTEEGKFTFIDIPVNFIYRKGLSHKPSFYASLGMIASLNQSAKFKVSGNASQAGYYPGHQTLLDEAAAYNFGSLIYDDVYNASFSSFTLNTSIEAGFSLPYKKNGYFNIGIGYQQNITDLGYKTSAYRDDLISINGVPNRSTLNYIYLSTSYSYKLNFLNN